ncbi:Transmembrane protein [Trema orientale]|uniref:Transmembrane protein n=1 Tax=Trema orientale TaxID=63057 RepID=A0A2P5EZF4_TREOI|nr:Transmembrane protein [Trema orientale]
MSFTSKDLFTNSPPRLTLYFTASPPKNPSLVSLPIASRHLTDPSSHFHISKKKKKLLNPCCLDSRRTHRFRLGVFDSEGNLRSDGADNGFDLDSLLAVVETLCIVSSAVVSIGFVVNFAVSSSKKAVMEVMGSRLFALGMVVLVAGVGIGAWIRRRQWRRFCAGSVKGSLEVNLLERVEKLEEDLRNSATIIRVLSRQLEKLGIRFRVTRKALKEPIAETAALAQKNSEATRALAIQEGILEKELGEIQKVLLAMQEQQQKQLELILAIGKTGKLWDTKQERSQEQERIDTRDSTPEGLKQKQAH